MLQDADRFLELTRDVSMRPMDASGSKAQSFMGNIIMT